MANWSSQLFDLRAPSSTDVPVLLLNQPFCSPARPQQRSQKSLRKSARPSFLRVLKWRTPSLVLPTSFPGRNLETSFGSQFHAHRLYMRFFLSLPPVHTQKIISPPLACIENECQRIPSIMNFNF